MGWLKLDMLARSLRLRRGDLMTCALIIMFAAFCGENSFTLFLSILR